MTAVASLYTERIWTKASKEVVGEIRGVSILSLSSGEYKGSSPIDHFRLLKSPCGDLSAVDLTKHSTATLPQGRVTSRVASVTDSMSLDNDKGPLLKKAINAAR